MLKKLSILDMHLAIKNRIETGTNLRCVEHIDITGEPPFAFVEIIKTEEKNTKTIYIDEFTLHVHVVSESANNSELHYQNIQSVQNALTDELLLPDCFDVFGKVSTGLIRNDIEKETNVHHAVLGFVIKISYGFKIKKLGVN